MRLGLNRRIAAVAVHDVFMSGVAFELAVWFRYLTYGEPQSFFFLWHGTLLFSLICGLVFWRAGLYRGIWHYASLTDLKAIVRGVTLALLVFLPVLFVLDRLENFPRSAMLIIWPLLIVLLAAPRLLYRFAKDGHFGAVIERGREDRVPVLLIGAGDEAESFIREMERSELAGYRVVGVIDHKTSRIGRDIHGIRVLGSLSEVDKVIAELAARNRKPQRLIIASSKIEGATIDDLLSTAEREGLKLASLPRVTDFKSDDDRAGSANKIRPVDVEDLLGRPQRVLDRTAIARLVGGRRVIVTGAGGTIGGELARQVAALDPAHLTLFDNNEHALYQIDLECGERWPAMSRTAVLGDVRDRARVDVVFTRERPDLVFHAAAFKHVPMVEANPNEGVLTNVQGTAQIADACERHGVDTMVLISTDKAVNPTSVMGASKRIAEMICQSRGLRGSHTRFVTVRFGNVLGSTGSVVPLFQRQLARGGPLTVTDPEMTRYFMTTREAVELVLQATAAPPDAGHAGAIYVLDMGQPVRIVDLARQMIRLAGLTPDVDVDIVFTGLRPGEKLYEELFHGGEPPTPTAVSGIQLATPRVVDHDLLNAQLAKVIAAAEARDTDRTMAQIRHLVPEFAPEKPENSAQPMVSKTQTAFTKP